MIKQLLHSRFQFCFYPEKNLRYFIVNYTLADSFKEKYDNIKAIHLKFTQNYEDQGSLIFGAHKNQVDGMMYIFHTTDERIPFDFIQQDPIQKEGLVINVKLDEIELKSKGKSKELAQLLQFR